VVVSPGKPDLAEYLAGQGIATVEQAEATGLAPAVVLAAGLLPALVLLPDTLFLPASPTPRLTLALNRGYDIAIAVERVPEEAVSRYGIVEWSPEHSRISRILEKPGPGDTQSRWAIAARFGISVRTLFFIRERVAQLSVSGSEIDLPPILDEAIQAGHTALAVPLETGESRLDCGNPQSYARACEVASARV
jgi:UTP-glucose-1-phosphate uridylyltransferase